MRQALTSRVLILTSVLLLLTTVSGCDKNRTFTVRTETIKVQSLDQIVLVADALVKPFLYTHVSGLEKLPVRKAKAKFISAVLPSILVAKHEIEQRRLRIEVLREKKHWNENDSALYIDLKNRYRAKDIDDLLVRTHTLPTSIVLAQAAVESGWGKSRFFLQANNLFGVWSFNTNESRIVARRTRENKRIYLRAYPDMSKSIIDYFEILARSRSYKSLREARKQTEDPLELLPHLKNYSERRTAYTNQLKKIILRNNLKQFDSYVIDPQYLVED
jgi:Bax protein